MKGTQAAEARVPLNQERKLSTMSDLIKLLRELETQRFYGRLEIRFEFGYVINIQKTESIRPKDADYRNQRGIYDRSEK